MKRDAAINWNAPVHTIGIERNADGTPIRDPFQSVWTLKGVSLSIGVGLGPPIGIQKDPL